MGHSDDKSSHDKKTKKNKDCDSDSSEDKHKHDKKKKKKKDSDSDSSSDDKNQEHSEDSSSDSDSYIRGYRKGRISGRVHAHHWGYSGPTGPDNWHTSYIIAKEGHQQSPINLTNAIESEGVDITCSYQPSSISVLNNGHTIQVIYFFFLISG